MQITAKHVSEVFDELLSGRLSREAAETWAEERMRLDDAEQLAFDPPGLEAQLRDALHYLSGAALRVSPTDYLHVDDDFIEYRRAAGF
jgi:hypothetical protein